MSLFYAKLGTLTISSGSTTSSALTQYLRDAHAITIQAPATLTGTVTVQGSATEGASYADVTSGGTDVTVAAGNNVTVSPWTFSALRLVSGSAEAGPRTFTVVKQFQVG